MFRGGNNIAQRLSLIMVATGPSRNASRRIDPSELAKTNTIGSEQMSICWESNPARALLGAKHLDFTCDN